MRRGHSIHTGWVTVPFAYAYVAFHGSPGHKIGRKNLTVSW